MIVWDIVFAVGIALVLTAIFAGIFRRTGPWASYLVFFAVIFLAAWVGGVWMAPVGPSLYGTFWVPFLLLGLLFALLMAAAMTYRPPRRRLTAERERRGESGAEVPTEAKAAIDAFFIVMIAALAIAVLFGYLVR